MDEHRRAAAEEDADRAAAEAQHDGFGEELPEDMVAPAPTAMRRPISRVRSVTETSMIFMIPTPPTTSEIMATTNSRMLICCVVELNALLISLMSRMLKSSVWPSLMRCRSCSNCVISSIACGISSVEAALTEM